jgi:cell division protein FtsB
VLSAGLLVAGAFVGVAVQGSAVDREADLARQQIAAEQARRAELEAEIARRQTESYVVDKARDYGYVRPGEAIIAVEGEARAPSLRVPSVDVDRLARWVAVFFGAR